MTDVAVFDYIRLHSMPLMYGALAYANAKRSTGGREEFNVKVNDGWYSDIDQLSFFRPYFRTVSGHDHTMFVLDIDTKVDDSVKLLFTEEEVRVLKLKAVMAEFSGEKWKKFLMYISGQGMYLVQKWDKVVDKTVFLQVLYGSKDSLFDKCTKKGMHTPLVECSGWHNRGQELVKKVMISGEVVTIIVDKRMFSQGRRLFRGVYSPYFKITGKVFYSVPVVRDGDGVIDVDETIRISSRENFERPNPVVVPEFSFEYLLKDGYDDLTANPVVREVRSRSVSRSNRDYVVFAPPVTAVLTPTQRNKLRKMEKLVNGDVKVTPPCVKNSYEQKYSRFWSRVMLVRYLAAKGFTPDDIAMFIRFKVNDEEDNSPINAHKLPKYVRMAYGSLTDPIPMTPCSKLQDERHEHYSCSKKDRLLCGRSYPLRPYPESLDLDVVSESGGVDQWVKDDDNTVNKDVVELQRSNFGKITELAGKILSSSANLEIIKTTRAGVTTSLISQVVVRGRRMIVVSPTNRIGEETFRDAMKITYQIYGTEINGAILSANTKGCLKLRFEVKDLEHRKRQEPDWGDYGVKWKDLAFHFKPSCVVSKGNSFTECEYYRERFPVPLMSDKGIPLPIISSEVLKYEYGGDRKGVCAYTSVINQLDDIDVLFITYDKLNSVLMNDSEDAVFIRNTLLDRFDVIFMDEISQLAQHSPLSFNVAKKDIEGTMKYTFFGDIEEEYSEILRFSDTDTVQDMGDFVRTFVDYFRPLCDKMFVVEGVDNTSFSYRYDNPIPEEDMEVYDTLFVAFYSILERYTKVKNLHLSTLEKVIILLKSRFWWLSNVPTNEYVVNAMFTSSPKLTNIREFISDFDALPNKLVLVTDATMPLIKMSDLLGVDFRRFVVGDPRGTQKNQIIISDTKSVSSLRLVLGMKSGYFQSLMDFVNKVCDTHGKDDVLLVLPNSGTVYRSVMDMIHQKRIPRVSVTYYRSDMTVGVSSDKRIMIAVCAPYPPSGSHMWLAQYYHEWGLFKDKDVDELSAMLETMNAYQTFYQTIGRVKSPDNTVRSVVYAWGIRGDTVNSLLGMDEDVPLPRIISVSHRGASLKYVTSVGKLWKDHGIIVDPDVIRIVYYLMGKKGRKFEVKTLVRRVFRTYTKDKLDDIIYKFMTVSDTVLDVYGIFTDKVSDDKVYIYAV